MGTGLAVLSVAGTASISAYGQSAGSAHETDVLLIDGSITMPRPVKAFIEANRHTTSVVDIRLDAAGHSELKRILQESRTVTGVTSGATLFCLERIAWDHGFRLTARAQRNACDLDGHACIRDVTKFLARAHPAAIKPSSGAHTYRPSQMDGTLQAWTMHKSARSHFSPDTREA